MMVSRPAARAEPATASLVASGSLAVRILSCGYTVSSHEGTLQGRLVSEVELGAYRSGMQLEELATDEHDQSGQ